ncbi:hypothetical protein TDB9533_00780 [Thalassocella blandensis]|nr:hypothetical protein TDB9533_00780 [Thalassocella blandensis]
MRFYKYLVFFVVVFLSSNSVNADPTDLKSQILEMDRKLFDAFNTRDLEATKSIFDLSLEFYHDSSGVSNYEQAIENTRRLFSSGGDLRRELLIDSVEIYPIKDFGAIQSGKHKFCHTENKKLDCGVFKFLHIWKNTENGWKLVRVISYAH